MHFISFSVLFSNTLHPRVLASGADCVCWHTQQWAIIVFVSAKTLC